MSLCQRCFGSSFTLHTLRCLHKICLGCLNLPVEKGVCRATIYCDCRPRNFTKGEIEYQLGNLKSALPLVNQEHRFAEISQQIGVLENELAMKEDPRLEREVLDRPIYSSQSIICNVTRLSGPLAVPVIAQIEGEFIPVPEQFHAFQVAYVRGGSVLFRRKDARSARRVSDFAIFNYKDNLVVNRFRVRCAIDKLTLLKDNETVLGLPPIKLSSIRRIGIKSAYCLSYQESFFQKQVRRHQVTINEFSIYFDPTTGIFVLNNITARLTLTAPLVSFGMVEHISVFFKLLTEEELLCIHARTARGTFQIDLPIAIL
jgi:hypothetical protein